MQNHAIMPNIPEEIIHNILLYLPVKSLLRFKSVSKSCLSHISTSRFINLHSQRSNSPQIFFQQFTSHLLTQSRSIIDINASFHDDSAFVPLDFPAIRSEIRGSCRGFLLLELDDKFIIWNPSTLEFREIPHYYRNPTFRYGFGYDSATDDYLILLIFDCPRDLAVRPVVSWVKIFSLRTNSWKNLDNNNYPYYVDAINDPYYNGAGCILDGAIHWLVLRNEDEIILAFDLTQREFREVPLPDDSLELHTSIYSNKRN